MSEINLLNAMIKELQDRLKTCDESHKAEIHKQLSRFLKDLAMAGWRLDGMNPF